MRSADDHSRWDEDLAAYAIGALDERGTAAFASHLAGCDRCRGELHRLAQAVELLPASVDQLEPPPALRRRIMAAIGEEPGAAGAETAGAETAGADTAGADAPGAAAAPAPRRSWRARLRARHLPALPAAATVAALAASFAIGFLLRGGGETLHSPRTTVTAAATAPGTDVRAQLVSDGGRWRLDVAHLPPLPPGRVYQAWVMRGGRTVEPSTVFVLPRDGSTEVAIPQSLDSGDQVLVTREPPGGSARPSSRPLLSAQV